jgi:hypothetical protein
VRSALTNGVELPDADEHGRLIGVGVRPIEEFGTYGVGVPLLAMRDTERARGRAPVASALVCIAPLIPLPP